MRISDWSSDVCSSDLCEAVAAGPRGCCRIRPGLPQRAGTTRMPCRYGAPLAMSVQTRNASPLRATSFGKTVPRHRPCTAAPCVRDQHGRGSWRGGVGTYGECLVVTEYINKKTAQ